MNSFARRIRSQSAFLKARLTCLCLVSGCQVSYVFTQPLMDSSMSLKRVVEGKWCWADRKKIKPLGQSGQYMIFPFTSLLLPFLMSMNYTWTIESDILDNFPSRWNNPSLDRPMSSAKLKHVSKKNRRQKWWGEPGSSFSPQNRQICFCFDYQFSPDGAYVCWRYVGRDLTRGSTLEPLPVHWLAPSLL